MNNKHKRGFTLIELLIVMGIIAILATLATVSINPGRQFASARNTQRVAHLHALMNAINEYMSEHQGMFGNDCTAGELPQNQTEIASTGYNLYDCLVPKYLNQIPVDPQRGSYTNSTSYSSGYTIQRETLSGRLIFRALHAENNVTIEIGL